MLEPININGATVSAKLHGKMYECLYDYEGVFNYGQKLGYQIISNNEIHIKDGLLVSHGRFMSIQDGTFETIKLENGQSGVNRCDLIVAHFETNDGVTETYSIKVIRGASDKEPSITINNNIFEMPLYAVHFQGLNISNVEPKFAVIYSVNDIQSTIMTEKDVDAMIGGKL